MGAWPSVAPRLEGETQKPLHLTRGWEGASGTLMLGGGRDSHKHREGGTLVQPRLGTCSASADSPGAADGSLQLT